MKYFALLYLPLFLFSISCKTKVNPIVDYSNLKYDTNAIKIFYWDTTRLPFPNNSEPIAITTKDIETVDSAIRSQMKWFNDSISPKLFLSFSKSAPLETFIINPQKYKRQYFPYKDVNGKKVFYIICFCNEFKEWKTKRYTGKLHNGICEITIMVNLSRMTVEQFNTGSYG